MVTGYSGTFVISWSQTEVDGLDNAPQTALTVGAAWSWRGDALRVDGPNDLLRLENANGGEQLRKSAAKMVQRLVGRALETEQAKPRERSADLGSGLSDNIFTVTDGARSYTVTLIDTGKATNPLLMFAGQMPPRDTDLWVVEHTPAAAPARSAAPSDAGGVICFTHGTRILTPDGPKLIEELQAGDYVQTKDNGPQEIQWVGARRMSGARLYAMPTLRPVRIRAGALGIDRPEEELLVSPEHRMLISGRVAQDLFNTPEVLVAARDLVNGDTIAVDLTVRHVTYVHLLLERHQVLWANGVATESFHPANAAFSTLADDDRKRLTSLYPDLSLDPHSYGSFARRNLTASEAALLTHAA
ncbi:Hint domain-containing protein [Aliishimia ponticola]|uniref:Hint domain-containing protein n=1 Tax=Aliishimia ponticola TaxID=2499833 RepID=A0A4V6S214_9RHOB|nr:Hint domain-containing protein [Aliishimia ponticola]THH36053.1 Hint domain-containing protein [Aliishimia ponticola]